jgi:hypothetical protein
LSPLVDELKRQAGMEISKRSQQAGRVEELRWASDLLFDSMRDLFVSMLLKHYEEREVEPEEEGSPSIRSRKKLPTLPGLSAAD